MNFYKPPFQLNEIKIEVTHKCPLACVHCSSDAHPSASREMSKEDCLKIIEEASNLGAKEVAFSGGEPLIWIALIDCIKFASEKGLFVTIYTSGNAQNLNEYFIHLKNAGIKRIIFSIFGSNENLHEKITRIKGSFDTTLEAIKESIKNEIRTELHFVPTKETYSDLPKIARLAEELGVKRISILRLVPQGRGALLKSQLLNKTQNLSLRRMIIDLRNKGFDIRTGSPYNFLILNEQPKCNSGMDTIIIGPEKRLYPCDAFKQVKAEELVGNLDFSTLAKSSLNDCWEKSPFLNEVRKYLTTPFEAPCFSCNILDKCLSGCLAQKVILTNAFDKQPDPMCIRKESEAE